MAEDTENAHERALDRALAADVVVTSGGVSVGPHDLVRRVEARLGVEEVFWGVAMRPGKPLAFGVRGRTLVFGLPGNPVSSLVGCLLFVVPALLRTPGRSRSRRRSFRPGRSRPRCGHGRSATTSSGRRIAWSEDGAVLDPIVGQESHMIVRTTAADAIVHVPRGAEPSAGGCVGPLPAALTQSPASPAGAATSRHRPVATGRECPELSAQRPPRRSARGSSSTR